MAANLIKLAAALLTVMTIIGCSSSPKYRRQPVDTKFKWQGERQEVLFTRLGNASYYGDEFVGRKTACGEVYSHSRFTAAHRSWPFGTRVRVTNLKNNSSVVVIINDRGPFVPDRMIDLSKGAAQKIGMMKDGIVKVKLEVLEWGEE